MMISSHLLPSTSPALQGAAVARATKNEQPSLPLEQAGNVSVKQQPLSTVAQSPVLSPQGSSEPMTTFLSDETTLSVSTSSDLGIFPKTWQAPAYRAQTQPVRPENLPTAKADLGKAENKYPSGLLQKYVAQTYVLGQLSFFDTPYAGTNSKDKVFVVADGTNDVEKTFHHELSSILLRRHPEGLNAPAWDKNLPSGFRYGGGTVAAHQNGQNSLTLDRKNLREGFVCDYSRSSRENDFNMIAENIFAGNTQFWRAVDQYPKLREKTQMVMAFYQRISSELTPDYFRSLVKP